MTWTAWEYRAVFTETYEGADEDTRDAIDQRLDVLLELGNQARRPITDHLRDDIFELRAKNVRLLFFFQPGKRIIFVVGFVKDQRKVPNAEIEKAIRIRALLLAGKEKASAIH